MMAQGERRAKAVLAAAVKFCETHPAARLLAGGSDESAPGELFIAVAKYQEVLAAKLPETPGAFYCPHCGAEKPGYGWNYNAGDTGPFAVAYLTCFCGECKGILSVGVTTFMPAKQLADALAEQFRGKLVKPA